MTKRRISCIMKYLAAFLIPIALTMVVMRALDNDSWFLLTEGRYINENGVFYTDVLSMHEGLEITVQQYGFAVIFWWIYSAFGPTGLYLTMLVLYLVILVLMYKICMLLSNKNVNLSLFIMVIFGLLFTLGFVTTRPQMVSFCIFLSVIYVLELYIKSNKVRYLWWIPVLSLIQINMHASVWWMIFLIMAAYFVDGIRKPKLRLQGYRKKPIVLIGLLAFSVGFLNPYGWKMVTYIFTSYGASEITNMVDEMKPFNLKTGFHVLLYIAIAGTMILYLFGNNKRVRMRYVLMYLGFLALGINSVKGMSQLILTMFFPLALMYKDVRIEKVIDDRFSRRVMMTWSGAVVVSTTITLLAIVPGNVKNYPHIVFARAIDEMDRVVLEEGKKKEDLKVYASYNWGGYVDFRGYKAYIDPRAEVFLERNNKKENILKEYNDLRARRINIDDFLAKYDFDYLLVDNYDGGMYEMEKKGYETIYRDEGAKVKVFKHVR